jgi:hypothetical protein
MSDRKTITLKYPEQCIKEADDKYITSKNGRLQTIFKGENGFYILDYDFGLVNVKIIF